MSPLSHDRSFWRTALSWSESVTPRVINRVLIFTVWSVALTYFCKRNPQYSLSVGLLEASGAVIALILIVRTNSGYDRWWEARKLWGGIVNQSRNLAIEALAYGADDEQWKTQFLEYTCQFPILAAKVLRDRPEKNEACICSLQLAKLISQAYQKKQISDTVFWSIEKQRSLLIDHLGACERILKSPLPLVLDINVRRFLSIYLLLVPISLVSHIGWFTPFLMFVISYSLLAVDQIGVELQNPFSKTKLSALPLEEIYGNIQKQIAFLRDEKQQH